MRSLTWDEVHSPRLARSHLLERAPADRLVPQEFREWVAAKPFRTPEAKALFARLGIAEVEVEGRPSWWLEDEPPSTGGSVRLLPEYDVYVMGFREREQLVPPAVREQVAAHGKGRYEGPAGTPLLLVDGVCAGIWSRRKTTKRIEIAVEPARKLTQAERAGIDAETERIGAFFGLEPRLAIV